MLESFDTMGLNPALVDALKKEMINAPTDIQKRVIPEALKNNDIIAQSGTGTGKTLAYLLPIFEKLNPTLKATQAIILSPTHELAVQIMRQIERLSENSDIKLSGALIIGNVNKDRQILKLKEKPNIIVGTPGRTLELIKSRKISAHTVKTIILDEADRLIDDSNIDNVKGVIKSTLKERQLMAFSATISKSAEANVKALMKETEVIRVEDELSVPKTISHIYFLTEQRDKLDVLRKLIRMIEPQRAIVFINNQGNEIEIYTSKLKHHGINAVAIHGSIRKLDRKKTMDDFRSGKIQILIASDVAAWGLHIEGVTHIFNVNIPEDVRDYVHRVGRSGRNGNDGTAISIVTEREMMFIQNYEKKLNIHIEPKDMYKGTIIDAKRTRKGL